MAAKKTDRVAFRLRKDLLKRLDQRVAKKQADNPKWSRNDEMTAIIEAALTG